MKKQLLSVLSLVFILSISCSEKKTNIQVKENSEKTITSSEIKTTNEENDELKNEPIKIISKTDKKQIASISKHDAPVNEEIQMLRKKHENFLQNSPFKKNMLLSKKERKAIGIPPNKYYEQEWELSMNPETGKPDVQKLRELRNRLNKERNDLLASGRTPGDGSDNNWIERGPNNVGGRVRAVMFDPNDATNETVFAGGVSGGLWKNTNISNSLSTWTRVNIPDNLAVSSITYDPNNSNTFYVGTGESYVGGDVNGDGVWKSIDGGNSWNKIFGGITGPLTFVSAANVTINSPAGIAGNYPCYPTNPANFGTAITSPITANIVLIADNTAPASDGCQTITNGAAISGNIALIRRGSCNFTVKVKAAQDAGAQAVIMMNNIDGTPIPMGGSDATIVIPSVMISKADGDILEAALGSGSVNATLNPSSGSFTGNLLPGQQHINDIKVRNNGGVSEIYVAAGDSYYGAANATTYLGGPDFGLYKSIDGGATFNEISLPLTANGNKHCPNNIEFGSDNRIWLATTNSVVFGDGGGKIFSSADGNTFVDEYTVSGGDRTQIAVSSQTANKVYVLAELSAGGVTMIGTTNGFTSTTTLALPDDADTGIDPSDFCRGQAFFDLMLEVDPTNDQILYTGGIDLFKSVNGGTSWNQFSHWYGGFGYQEVHSDQHGLAFGNGASNKLLFGNDGGVYFSNNGGTTTSARNRGLNITQFYSVGVSPTAAVSGLTGNDYFAAGAQDNGTQYFANAAAGVNPSTETQGGDGAFTMFDQGADKYYISNYVYNNNINLRPIPSGTVRALSNDASSATNGAFIAPMVLDSNQDVLYSDYSTTTPAYQIRRYKNIKSGTVNRVNLTNALLTSPPTAFAVSPYTTTSTTLLVGTRLGKLLKITTANTIGVWSDITGSQFVGSISDVEYGATENDIFVTMHNYNVVSVWYSSDAGVTWQNKEGNLPDLPVKCILQNPLNVNEVIIGTELGVWYTNNFGIASPTWNQSYNGMSNVKVTDLDLRNDNTVYAATYGRGIFSGLFTATSLSSDDVTKNKGIKIYPNPSNGVVNVSVENYSGNLNLEVYDINGRKVLSNSLNFSIQTSVNLEGLQSGIYVLKLEGDNLSYSEKIILQ